MNEEAFFNCCKELAGDTSEAIWTEDHLAGFFQNFRPDGEALEQLFNDIPGGNEVYDRLKQIYAATASDYQHGATVDAYFIVRSAARAEPDTLMGWATTQLANWRQMAEQVYESELVALLTPLPQIKIKTETPPQVDPNDYDSLDVFIYDVQTDWWIGKLTPICPQARWMREAFYFINCDYYLARYAAWPWYRESSSLADPYKPYFALWLHGAELRCQSPDDVTLYVKS